MAYSASTHWRDSARPARFFVVDYRAAFPFLLFLLHIRWWTLYVAVCAMCFFAALERYGFTVPVFGRWLRTAIGGFLTGGVKIAVPWWRRY